MSKADYSVKSIKLKKQNIYKLNKAKKRTLGKCKTFSQTVATAATIWKNKKKGNRKHSGKMHARSMISATGKI